MKCVLGSGHEWLQRGFSSRGAGDGARARQSSGRPQEEVGTGRGLGGLLLTVGLILMFTSR